MTIDYDARYEIAKTAFNAYVRGFDSNNERVRVKISHTYGVVECASYLARELQLGAEETYLVKIIALLHDIGRFEQLKRYDDFSDKNIDHAKLGVEVLQHQHFIAHFGVEKQDEDLIYFAIGNHNTYTVQAHEDNRYLFHANIIRDADKLDNFRIKKTESFQVLFHIEYDELIQQEISPLVYDTFLHEKLIKRSDRITRLDEWVSYIAFLFDFNFRESFVFLQEHNLVNAVMNRVKPANPATLVAYRKLQEIATRYVEKHAQPIQQ
jgi:putative nucleotidyltransferase with HDIG domain